MKGRATSPDRFAGTFDVDAAVFGRLLMKVLAVPPAGRAGAAVRSGSPPDFAGLICG
jgi:hypothetical protein